MDRLLVDGVRRLVEVPVETYCNADSMASSDRTPGSVASPSSTICSWISRITSTEGDVRSAVTHWTLPPHRVMVLVNHVSSIPGDGPSGAVDSRSNERDNSERFPLEADA